MKMLGISHNIEIFEAAEVPGLIFDAVDVDAVEGAVYCVQVVSKLSDQEVRIFTEARFTWHLVGLLGDLGDVLGT